MKVTVDTNILIRAAMRDDIQQAAAASQLLKDAEIIAIPLPCLCEFVWVLRRVYGIGRTDIRAALQALLDAGNVAVQPPGGGCRAGHARCGRGFRGRAYCVRGAMAWWGNFRVLRQERSRFAGQTGPGSEASRLIRFALGGGFRRGRGSGDSHAVYPVSGTRGWRKQPNQRMTSPPPPCDTLAQTAHRTAARSRTWSTPCNAEI